MIFFLEGTQCPSQVFHTFCAISKWSPMKTVMRQLSTHSWHGKASWTHFTALINTHSLTHTHTDTYILEFATDSVMFLFLSYSIPEGTKNKQIPLIN